MSKKDWLNIGKQNGWTKKAGKRSKEHEMSNQQTAQIEGRKIGELIAENYSEFDADYVDEYVDNVYIEKDPYLYELLVEAAENEFYRVKDDEPDDDPVYKREPTAPNESYEDYFRKRNRSDF